MKGNAPLEKLELGPPPSIPKRSVALSWQKDGPISTEAPETFVYISRVFRTTSHKIQTSPTINAVQNSYPAVSLTISSK